MNYLKLPKKRPVAIDKPYFTVGSGAGYDIIVAGSSERILFTINQDKTGTHLIPGDERVWVNGKAVSRVKSLQPCDRIEWKGESAVFLADPISVEASESKNIALKSLQILQNLSLSLDKAASLNSALCGALEALVELAGAEMGYLVSEIGTRSEWELLASVGDTTGLLSAKSRRRDLISSTILNEAIAKRKPVYVESMVGHPWADQASIMAAQVFSLACLPLIVGDRVFGTVYLYTRTPGKSIDKDSLEELNLLATQVALVLAYQAELRLARSENRKLRRLMPAPSTEIVYDRKNMTGAMAGLDQRIGKLADSELNILILGETGTGKELIARAIHKNSQRSKGPFVAINCAAIPPSLIESTLFGYVKGAFTGANKDHPGKFVQASGGTLFLDEIGDLPLDLQAKLLRVLQEKEVEPVGGTQTTKVDFRVVAATHSDLQQSVGEDKFRKDLYYRLNGASVKVPALRDRGHDVVLLAEYFLRQHSEQLNLSEAAREQLQKHAWPGNVRELEQVMTRASALCGGSEILPEDLELGEAAPSQDSVISTLQKYEDLHSLKEAQNAFTQDFVKQTLAKFGGNRSKAASQLGISERTLYRILSNESVERI